MLIKESDFKNGIFLVTGFILTYLSFGRDQLTFGLFFFPLKIQKSFFPK